MDKPPGRRHILTLAFLSGIGCALLPVASVRAQAPALPPEWEKVRAALEKYQDPYVAVRDGYLSTVGCVHYPKPGGAGQIAFPIGGMGIHFLNPELIAPVPDPMRPTILLYEPRLRAERRQAAPGGRGMVHTAVDRRQGTADLVGPALRWADGGA